MKYSRQRNIVLDIMKNSYSHPTAEEVYIEAQKTQPEIGLATVYRNLNQLVEMGEVKRIPMPTGHDRYDGHLEEHYHLLCTKCGQLQDLRLDSGKLEALTKLAGEAFGLKAGNRARLTPVVMEGTCDVCRKNKKVV